MPVERSAGAVVFRKNKKGEVEYLLLHHFPSENGRGKKPRDGHWSLPKGHIEAREKTEDAVLREVEEETGLKQVEFIPGFKETIRYFVNFSGERRLKFVAFFLLFASEQKVLISDEHQNYVWLPYKKAFEKITYAGDKNVIKKANSFLNRISGTGL